MISNLFIISYSLAFFFTGLSIYSNANKNKVLPFFLLFTICLIIFAGFNTASPDYMGYKGIALAVGDYDDFYSGSSTELHGDFTFYVISSLVNSLGLDIQFVFIIISFISVGVTAYIVYKLSYNPMLSILLFSSHHYLNKDVIHIRTALSSAFLLLAIYIFTNRSKFWGVISYIFSILSHSSSLITLPPILFSQFFSKKNITKILVLFLILSFIINFIGGGFFGILQYIEPFLPSGVKNYLNWDIYNYDMGLLNLSLIRALFFSCILILLFNKYEQTKEEIIFLFCYVFGTCILISFSDFAILSGRLSSVLMSAEFIILVNASSKLKNKKYILFCLLFYSSALLLNNILFSSYELGKFEFNLI
ncbi:EpsG family protein [Providencia rettgeri]|uniref:EpsG family protein n=1 Tax=Providencia sp. PROV069 TaxID=2949795 RepID=UPI00234B0582|nr:EpsG family protein [Providencia sp. PROV069]